MTLYKNTRNTIWQLNMGPTLGIGWPSIGMVFYLYLIEKLEDRHSSSINMSCLNHNYYTNKMEITSYFHSIDNSNQLNSSVEKKL